MSVAYYIRTFTLWEFVKAHALTRHRHAELVSASIPRATAGGEAVWTPGSRPGQALKQVQGDVEGVFA